MERGNLVEPIAVELVRRRHPEWTVTYRNDRAYYRDPAARIGATPDAFVEIPNIFGTGNLQIKSTNEENFRKYWWDEETESVAPPLWTAVQAIVEAKLTGCSYAHLALLVLTWRGTFKLYIVNIPLHDRMWAALKVRVAKFWEMTASGVEPEPNWGRDIDTVLDVHGRTIPQRIDLSADPQLDASVHAYVEAKRAERSIVDEARLRRAEIIRKLGAHEGAFTKNWKVSAPEGALGRRTLRVSARETVNENF